MVANARSILGRPSLGRTMGVGSEVEREKGLDDDGEALQFGDSVTLFAEKMFGFLQGAGSGEENEDDDEASVFVRSLEHRHRPTGVRTLGMEERASCV